LVLAVAAQCYRRARNVKKRQVVSFVFSYQENHIPFIYCVCRKRKTRKNITKGWFSKVVGASSPPDQDVGASSPPWPPMIYKKAVRKMTPKKKAS
jgi:hypothetical protein